MKLAVIFSLTILVLFSQDISKLIFSNVSKEAINRNFSSSHPDVQLACCGKFNWKVNFTFNVSDEIARFQNVEIWDVGVGTGLTNRKYRAENPPNCNASTDE